MKNDGKSLIQQAQNIDNQINYWQFMAKCDKLRLDLSIMNVNKLVEQKKDIVEKLKKLDILYLNTEYPHIHKDNNNNNNNE